MAQSAEPMMAQSALPMTAQSALPMMEQSALPMMEQSALPMMAQSALPMAGRSVLWGARAFRSSQKGQQLILVWLRCNTDAPPRQVGQHGGGGLGYGQGFDLRDDGRFEPRRE